MLRIAIVEDHESDAKRLTALLEAYAQKNGKRFAITWIANANTFLDSYQHQYELVFMDIRMPGLNGMMAAHELREMDHTVVLVFLTSLAQYAVESYEVEATDYILKPITAAALDLKLPRILNRCMVESEEEVVIQSGGTTKCHSSSAVGFCFRPYCTVRRRVMSGSMIRSASATILP